MNSAIQNSIPVAIVLICTSLTARADIRDCLKRSDNWLASTTGRNHLDNLLTHQTPEGCWPKNIDTTLKPYKGGPDGLKGTFDNGATVDEIRVLARAYNILKKEHYKTACLKGLQCILESQYSNGGWPQAPNPNGYQKHITFNDGTMVGIMNLLREVHTEPQYDFVSQKIRQQSQHAFDMAVNCILDCQIRVNGKLTAWCAQHDRVTLAPRGARSYEHASLSGHESAGIILLLMDIKQPSKRVRESVKSAVNWFSHTQINGIQIRKNSDGDKQVTHVRGSSPLWARFYEIETNRPIFSGRDGVIRYRLEDIEAERRNGYSWYVNSGEKVLHQWKTRGWQDYPDS